MRAVVLLISIFATGVAFAAPAKLKPGEFEWNPERSPSGPLLIVCSLDDQMLYAFRNGVQFARSTMELGNAEEPPSTGVFFLVQSDVDPDAKGPDLPSLPFIRQLTHTDISLPSPTETRRSKSGDKIKLPPGFSKNLYAQMKYGATVAITRKNTVPVISDAPSRVLLKSSSPENSERAIPKGRPIWEPHKSPTGPVSILLSYADSTIYVWRNGIQIGQCPVFFSAPVKSLPKGVFLMLDGKEKPDPLKPDHVIRPWSVLNLTESADMGNPVSRLRDHIVLDPEFSSLLNKELTPGTLFLATNQSSKAEDAPGPMSIGTMDDLPDPE